MNWFGGDVKVEPKSGSWNSRKKAQKAQNKINHVDTMEAISDDPNIIEEKRTHGKFMPDKYAMTNEKEYVAEGFELFYFGNKEEKKQMKINNKYLYGRIMKAHKKYLSK